MFDQQMYLSDKQNKIIYKEGFRFTSKKSVFYHLQPLSPLCSKEKFRFNNNTDSIFVKLNTEH